MNKFNRIVLSLFILVSSTVINAKAIIDIEYLRSFLTLTKTQIAKLENIKIEYSKVPFDDSFKNYAKISDYPGVRFKFKDGAISRIEVHGSELIMNLPQKIGNEYCNVIEQDNRLTFGYKTEFESWVMLTDEDYNVKYWFNAESYLRTLQYDGIRIKKDIEYFCGMKLSWIEILKK
jgi:hypothetical protein